MKTTPHRFTVLFFSVGLLAFVATLGASLWWHDWLGDTGVWASDTGVWAGDTGESSATPDERAYAKVLVRSVSECRPEVSYDEYVGILRPRHSADVSAKLSERLEFRAVDVGDRVEQGDVLARLGQADLQSLVALAEAELEGTQAVLAELVAGPRKQELDRSRAQVQESEASVELHKVSYGRMLTAGKSGAVASSEVDQANFLLRAAEAQLLTARAALEELELGVRPERIAAQRAAVAAASAKLAQLTLQLDETLIRAPFSGTVQAVFAHEGELLQAGQPVMQVLETSTLEVHAGMPPAAIARLRESYFTGYVEVVAGDTRFAAKLDRVAPAIDDATGMQKVVFAVEDLHVLSKPAGMAVTVRVPTSADAGVWLPKSSLLSSAQGQWSCYVASPTGENGVHRLEQKSVEVLDELPGMVSAQGELDASSLVVVAGTHRLVPGQLVCTEPSPGLPSVEEKVKVY